MIIVVPPVIALMEGQAVEAKRLGLMVVYLETHSDNEIAQHNMEQVNCN